MKSLNIEPKDIKNVYFLIRKSLKTFNQIKQKINI